MIRALLVFLCVCLAVGPAAARILTGARAAESKRVFRSQEHRFFNHEPLDLQPSNSLPTSFTWADVHGIDSTLEGTSLLTPSWYCGSCYLHGSLHMIQDRISIATRGRSRVMLGRQTFLNCAPLRGYSGGCGGGTVYDVLDYMSEYGLPDETCLHYSATDHTALRSTSPLLSLEKQHCAVEHLCRNCMPKRPHDSKHAGDDDDGDDDEKYHCWGIPSPILYKVTAFGVVGTPCKDKDGRPTDCRDPKAINANVQVGDLTEFKREQCRDPKAINANAQAMMNEIHQRGPILCAIACDDAFDYAYDGGIFNSTKMVGDDVDHNVEVIGWGEEKGVKYWIARNSWGSYWGQVGFFRVQMGINSMMIEDGYCYYATPDLSMEQQVAAGQYIGSMDGLIRKKVGAQVVGATL